MNIYKINNEEAKVRGCASTLPVLVGPNKMFTTMKILAFERLIPRLSRHIFVHDRLTTY